MAQQEHSAIAETTYAAMKTLGTKQPLLHFLNTLFDIERTQRGNFVMAELTFLEKRWRFPLDINNMMMVQLEDFLEFLRQTHRDVVGKYQGLWNMGVLAFGDADFAKKNIIQSLDFSAFGSLWILRIGESFFSPATPQRLSLTRIKKEDTDRELFDNYAIKQSTLVIGLTTPNAFVLRYNTDEDRFSNLEYLPRSVLNAELLRLA